MGDLPGPEKMDWVGILKKEMSPSTASRPTYTPERVRPRHRIAIALYESGWKSGDIAKALGYTPARMSVILNSHNPHLQDFKAQFASQVADNVHDVHTRFKLYANEMLDILVGHARRENAKPELSRLAARDILFMAGFTPVKKQLSLEGKLPTEDLKRAFDKIAEANEVVLSSEKWNVKEPAA